MIDFKNADPKTAEIKRYLLPECDETIRKLEEDFYVYRKSLVTLEDNEGDVFERWKVRPSERLDGMTPYEFIRDYTGDPPVFEKYERIILNLIQDNYCSPPDSVFEDFFSICDRQEWAEKVIGICLDAFSMNDTDVDALAITMIYGISEHVSGFSDDLCNRFFETAKAVRQRDPELASDLVQVGVDYCKNGFDVAVDVIAKRMQEDKPMTGPVAEKLLAVLALMGRKDEKLYVIYRTLVKRTALLDERLEFYFDLVCDYGDPRAVSFMRTKGTALVEAYKALPANAPGKDILFRKMMRADEVIKTLGGQGVF